MTDCILMGLPRSGTTLLGRVIASSGLYHYEEEPNPVWRYRNFSVYRHDEYTPADSTPYVRKYITDYFMTRTRKAGKTYFLEKTPSNCLRCEFVSDVFPNANYIILSRASEQIEKSIVKKIFGDDSNASFLNDERFARDLRSRFQKAAIVPFADYPAYLDEVRRQITRRGLGANTAFWGPRPHHWKFLERLPLELRVAQQVAYMQTSLERFKKYTQVRVSYVKYEELTSNPDKVLGELEHFLGVESGVFPRSIIQIRDQGQTIC